jgi:cell division septation protein DedD
MASGVRKTAGERVLEGKHVIGLFLLMLLFSGVFFTLGYVMGRNQYDGWVRAATTNSRPRDSLVSPKSDSMSKKPATAEPAESDSDPATSAAGKSDWEFYNNSTPAKPEPRLDPAPKGPGSAPTSRPLNTRAKVEATPAPVPVKSSRPVSIAPSIPGGAILLQVAAVSNQDDALSIAGSLQRKHFPATVLTSQKDRFYRVQVGPYRDQKSADAAKKGLEDAGFKAFYVKH